MGLNIKNEETCRLAGELARITGTTKTGAITLALRECLAPESTRHGTETRLREMRSIAERCVALVGPGASFQPTRHHALRRTGAAQMIVDTSALLAHQEPRHLGGYRRTFMVALRRPGHVAAGPAATQAGGRHERPRHTTPMLKFSAEEHRPRWGARPSKPLRRSKRLVGSTPTSSATRTPQTLENTEQSQRRKGRSPPFPD